MTLPTYREINEKLVELEKDHKLLGARYNELTKILRKQGKDSVQPLDMRECWGDVPYPADTTQPK